MKQKPFITLLAAAAVFFVSGQACALSVPKGSSQDARIQTVTYSPNNVFHIRAQIGRAVLVQLEADERLEGDSATLGMGDSEAWKLNVKGNNIIFKPTAPNPETNLIVTTNKRTYVFQLSIDGRGRQAPTYVLRFRYPDTQRANVAAQRAKNNQAHEILSGKKLRPNVVRANQNYWGYGDKSLTPTAMYDDGRFTYLEFDNGRDMPSIYKIMPDGTESLVNLHVEGNTVVVHELSNKFVLRLGNTVLGVDNRGFSQRGRFNQTGAGQDGRVRIVK
ncbi:Conjugal transfer-like protein (plasmid) [Advenella kashmirensis WT001]|uniref:Conjugal transfer-like protein n=2 Tax=Advenella TaxID=290425 RepID=I3UHZ4_ADVKW|nr:P-type conjugative transfer protein VirB9 [Advenella kashmirensis]ACD43635.1 TagB9 [Advenella kashmirensis]AFK64632.1 Conjugal transfer-like protein [Advenella kashmirensis WT001]